MATAPKGRKPAKKTTGNPAGGSEAKRGSATYPMKEVERPPEDIATGRSKLYVRLLRRLKDSPGKWFLVTHFRAASSAREAVKGLENGSREKPSGRWEFDAVQVPNPDAEGGPNHSELYAKFLGE